ncbi:MAG: L,D-transpeptidase [Actinomycetes bacterium]|nr:L,D-transpeptidase [Actinomycetes bacterium]
MKKRFLTVTIASVVSVVLLSMMATATATVASGATIIKPGVTIALATNKGQKTVKVGGLTTAEAKKKLGAYTLKATPKQLYFTDRDWTRSLKTSDLKLKPSIAALVKEASQVGTDTAVGGTYVTAAAKKKLTARLKSFAKKFKVKAKTVKVAGGGKLKNFGGRALDQKAALDAAIKALNAYGTGKAKKPKVLAAPITASKWKMTGRSGKGKVLVASLVNRQVFLFKGNKKVVSYGICVGMPGYATPTGTMRVARKRKNPVWHNPGAGWSRGMAEAISGSGGPLGKAALYLTRGGKDEGIRFHGTAKSWSIGKAQSHGCMRLTNKNVLKLYKQVPVGTKVTVVK